MTRIIGGVAKGRRLQVPGQLTRPTSDRVRESLFSRLEALAQQHRAYGKDSSGQIWPGLSQARVLDLFAGSGALGLEALSRGAAHVTFVEQQAPAVKIIRKNLATVAPGTNGRGTVVATKVDQWLTQSSTAVRTNQDTVAPQFNLVFLDPPYDLPDAALNRTLELLTHSTGLLAPVSLVVVERSKKNPLISWEELAAASGRWEALPARDYGDSRIQLAFWYRHDVSNLDQSSTATVRRAVCPGSFDPVTMGHLDMFLRASPLFDELTVAVLHNQSKTGLFSIEERIDMIETGIAEAAGVSRRQTPQNIRVDSFHGLLVDFCRERDIDVILKGLRAVSDFDYELQMAQLNYQLSGVETFFLTTNPKYSYLSSSLMKEVVSHGGDVTGLVPASVLPRLRQRLGASGSDRSDKE